MIYALADNGEKIRAARGIAGHCGMCGEELIPKCGRIVTHHWAHKGKDCDPWREAETEWHRYWKSLVPASCVEVTIEKNGERHRADIVTPKGTVVELQHSTLGVDKIEQREKFYGRMIWLFDVREARPDPKYDPRWYSGKIPINLVAIRLRLRKNEKGYHTFRWYHPGKSIAYTSAETYLDVGRNEVFRVRKMGKTRHAEVGAISGQLMFSWPGYRRRVQRPNEIQDQRPRNRARHLHGRWQGGGGSRCHDLRSC